jgi:hypothetical protein
VFYPNLIHLTCLCHGLNRVCEKIRGLFQKVDDLIAATKKVFAKAPSRVARFHELCDLPLPPRPIITRWGTWLNAAIYYCDNFDAVNAVIESFNPADSDAIQKSQIAFHNPTIRDDLAFIKAHFYHLPTALEKLQSADLPLVQSLHFLFNPLIC